MTKDEIIDELVMALMTARRSLVNAYCRLAVCEGITPQGQDAESVIFEVIDKTFMKIAPDMPNWEHKEH